MRFFCWEKKTTRPQHITCPFNENVILCSKTRVQHSWWAKIEGKVYLKAFFELKNESLPPGETKGSKGSLLPSCRPLTGESLGREKGTLQRSENKLSTVKVTDWTNRWLFEIRIMASQEKTATVIINLKCRTLQHFMAFYFFSACVWKCTRQYVKQQHERVILCEGKKEEEKRQRQK